MNDFVALPNVLVVDPSLIVESSLNKFIIKFKDNYPNLKKNKAYYLMWWTTGGSPNCHRCFHVESYEVDEKKTPYYIEYTMTIKYGNSFVVKKKFPEIDSLPYQYVSLKEFGLQQISPGTLIEIK